MLFVPDPVISALRFFVKKFPDSDKREDGKHRSRIPKKMQRKKGTTGRKEDCIRIIASCKYVHILVVWNVFYQNLLI